MTEEEDQLARDVRETQEILRIATTTANSVAEVGNALGFVRAVRERDEARQELAQLRREVERVAARLGEANHHALNVAAFDLRAALKGQS